MKIPNLESLSGRSVNTVALTKPVSESYEPNIDGLEEAEPRGSTVYVTESSQSRPEFELLNGVMYINVGSNGIQLADDQRGLYDSNMKEILYDWMVQCDMIIDEPHSVMVCLYFASNYKIMLTFGTDRV